MKQIFYRLGRLEADINYLLQSEVGSKVNSNELPTFNATTIGGHLPFTDIATFKEWIVEVDDDGGKSSW